MCLNLSFQIGSEKEQPSQDTTLTSSSGQIGSQEMVELSGSTFYRGPLQQLYTTASTRDVAGHCLLASRRSIVQFQDLVIFAGSLEAAYSLNWGAWEIWGKVGGETLALLW